jgi:large subunit ribosomal protein L3
MALGLIGKKVGMTRTFNEDGTVVPVTIVQLGPCSVVNIQTPERNGYSAIQLGFDDIQKHKLKKAQAGQYKNMPTKRKLKEFRIDEGEINKYKVGDIINLDIFEEGQKLDVRGTSKGKGFAGVMKRHNFHGGPKTHGSNFHRLIGAIGNSASPNKVFKGKKMPGRMGNETVCVQNLEVIKKNLDDHTIAIKGAIPGSINSYVYVIPAKKHHREKKSRY